MSQRISFHLIVEMYEFIRDFKGEVPGAAPKDCGNYLDMNLGVWLIIWRSVIWITYCMISNRDRLVYPESRIECNQGER